jgi:recombination protein RecA
MSKLQEFFKSFAEADDELGFHLASDVVDELVDTVGTGSLLLDDALSSGGLPCGRIIQYYGPSGSGKTLLSLCAIKEAQIKDPESMQVFIDAEQTFSPAWSESLGIDVSRVIIVDGDLASNGRKCFQMLLGVPKEDKSSHVLVGKKTEGMLDKIRNNELNINLIILDSLGAIIPPIEDVAIIGKSNMATLARFLTSVMKKLSLEVKKAKIPFIVINHKRENMDPYGADHTYSGGNSYTHFLSANVYFVAPQRKDAQLTDEKERRTGTILKAKVEKSKFGPWPRDCEFKVDFSQGVIDKHEEVAKLALEYGIVQKPNNVSHVYGDQKWVGESKFFEALKEDLSLMKEIKSKTIQARILKNEEKRKHQAELKDSLESESQSETETFLEELKTKKKAKV